MIRARKSFRTGIIVRILLLLSVGITAFLIATKTSYWLVGAWMGVLEIVLILELIRFHERTYRALGEFLLFIKQGEFASMSTIDEKNIEFQEAYKMLFEKFRNLRIERETNYHYLQRIIEHVDTALICLKDEQNIQLINKTAQKLLQVSEIKTLGAIVKVNDELAQLIGNIQSGDKEMIRFIRHGRIMKLSIRATEFTLDGEIYKIVSLQDIKSELEEQELDSWQKLVRVLTHEIMNSAIPITNMVSMARQILLDEEGKPKEIPGLSQEDSDDLMESLYTAESRSQGLTNFVQSTKSLTRIPEPSFGDIIIKDLFKRLREIFKGEREQKGVSMNFSLQSDSLLIKADVGLIEQVLINIIRNAMDAMAGKSAPVLDISAHKTLEGGLVIRICDNGEGIAQENMDHIFVPFYTTKKEGSGIGLSLSMQIMKLHKGRIDIQSEPGKGTCVTLEF